MTEKKYNAGTVSRINLGRECRMRVWHAVQNMDRPTVKAVVQATGLCSPTAHKYLRQIRQGWTPEMEE